MIKIVVVSLLILIGASISFVFWKQELQYVTPTPVPHDYQPVTVNHTVELASLPLKENHKPIHLHFFNPDCPCSRFNIDQFMSLVRTYNEEIDFYVVVPTQEHQESVNIKFKGIVSVLVDPEQEIAREFGVYSTPQAVLVDTTGKLFYRGNYNRTRYCLDPKTNFAKMAIESIIAGESAPDFHAEATTSYGCELKEKNYLGFYIY